jgi:hypothetical protein
MDGPNQISAEAYLARMRQTVEDTLRQVAAAVNDAPDGAWINDSEWQVFAAFTDLRRAAYEQALQMRADAAASAFSPGGPGERPPQSPQGG